MQHQEERIKVNAKDLYNQKSVQALITVCNSAGQHNASDPFYDADATLLNSGSEETTEGMPAADSMETNQCEEEV